jgi:hypothetical protein
MSRMKRALVAAFFVLGGLSCTGDAERLPPPLPQDGTALQFSQVLARLSAQANTAKEEHFLNHWEGVVDAAIGMDHSAAYLLKSPDLPPFHKARIEKEASQLKADIVNLRQAARNKDQTESLELIRRIHNQIREMQDLK